jgi:RNA-directed DNA polymerase
LNKAKSFLISKHTVWDAFKRVKANKGAAGYDKQSIKDFEKDLKNNLYKIWNRMSSGSYLPPPVLRVEIPKDDGKTRPLGIPTVSDRIAQMVVKIQLEPELEKHFHSDSYGYSPFPVICSSAEYPDPRGMATNCLIIPFSMQYPSNQGCSGTTR